MRGSTPTRTLRRTTTSVTLVPTEIGPRARIGSHAIVLAGTRVGPGEIVGIFPADRA